MSDPTRALIERATVESMLRTHRPLNGGDGTLECSCGEFDGSVRLSEHLADALAALSTTPAPEHASLLRELDACETISDGRGPGPGRNPAPTFTAWRVPDWLMKRVRAALEGTPHDQ